MAALKHSSECGSVLTAPEQPPHGELLRAASSWPGLISARERGQPAGGGQHRDAALPSEVLHFNGGSFCSKNGTDILYSARPLPAQNKSDRPPPSLLPAKHTVFVCKCLHCCFLAPVPPSSGGSQSWRGLEKLQNLWSCLILMRILDQCFPNLGVGTRPLSWEQALAGPVSGRDPQGLPHRLWGCSLTARMAVYLPERIKLLPIRDGELPCLVLVDAVVQHSALMQQAQGVGPVVVPGPDPGRQEEPVTPEPTPGRNSAPGLLPATAPPPQNQGLCPPCPGRPPCSSVTPRAYDEDVPGPGRDSAGHQKRLRVTWAQSRSGASTETHRP